MDNHTPEQRRKNMQAIRSSGSKIETLLAKALWAEGYRYRKNCKNILGKPDIVLRKYRLVIFCDSEFWHGKNWNKQKSSVHTHKKFWNEKIKKNILRDRLVNKTLSKQGWKVLRFWGKEIEKNLEKCLFRINNVITISSKGE